jgi:acyl-coenzyme A thioesterase PaaI-like protein
LKLSFHDDGVEVRSECTLAVEYQGYPGIAHGGIVALILDEVVGRVSRLGDPNHLMMTLRMEVTYRRPVPVETPLSFVGRPVKMGGRLAQAIGEVILPDGSVAVEAALTLVDLPEPLRTAADLDAVKVAVDS